MIDITANVDLEFLNKYHLQPNNAILGDEDNYDIYDELKKKYGNKLEYTSGGSGQNTLRTISWILDAPNVTLFVGCVGQDKHAEIIKDKASEIGLRTLFQVTEKANSATCAVLLTGKQRSLVCHLGAANYFTADFMFQENNWPLIESNRIFYITGFFFTVCFEAVLKLSRFAFENERVLAINFSAKFIAEFYKKELALIMPYVDILFGNDEEAFGFAKNVLSIQTTDIRKVIKKISLMAKFNKKKRIIVITRADKAVLYCIGSKVNEIVVPRIDSDKIIDTSSAGDAFVGGFLAQYIKNEPIEKCIDCGIWASGLIIQRNGCTFPNSMDYR